MAARNAPGCVQRPRTPFVLAANGPKALALTARHGQGWITIGTDHDSRRFLQTDAAPVFSLSSVEVYRDFLGRASELGFTDVLATLP